jgi:hypothetical protein
VPPPAIFGPRARLLQPANHAPRAWPSPPEDHARARHPLPRHAVMPSPRNARPRKPSRNARAPARVPHPRASPSPPIIPRLDCILRHPSPPHRGRSPFLAPPPSRLRHPCRPRPPANLAAVKVESPRPSPSRVDPSPRLHPNDIHLHLIATSMACRAWPRLRPAHLAVVKMESPRHPCRPRPPPNLTAVEVESPRPSPSRADPISRTPPSRLDCHAAASISTPRSRRCRYRRTGRRTRLGPPMGGATGRRTRPGVVFSPSFFFKSPFYSFAQIHLNSAGWMSGCESRHDLIPQLFF